MSRAIFMLLVIGVFVSVINARSPPHTECTGANQEYTSCGSACPPSCNSRPNQPCTLQCVIGCQCKQGYVLNSSGECVPPSAC